MPRPAPRRASPGLALLVLLLKALWVAFVITTPLLGAWAASSLAAYQNGPVAVAAATGLLLFPGLPLAWEAWSARRRTRRGVTKPRILTFGDRLVLRTLAVNLLFLGVLLGTRPEAAFAAISTRGDWMLDGRQGERADAVRRFLFRAADRLEWIYLAVHDDTFARKGEEPKPKPTPSSTVTSTPVPPPVPTAVPSGKPQDRPAPAEPAQAWPLPPTLHPAVASMPADAEQSIESVARYIADRDSTPAGRLKAAHDWVADRIAYDAPAYAAHQYPPHDARAVFARRTAVCAGYAELLAELGKALGLEILYVHGDARTDGSRETGESHAWNVARLGGRYVLLDATWDSGSIDGTKFKKEYRTDYFLTPPEIFSIDHFPADASYQLRATPLSRGEFFRQPMMTPRFHAEHRELVSPTRSQVTVRGPLEVVMRAPPALFTSATWSRRGSAERTHCKVTRGDLTRVSCALPAAGLYSVELFSNTEEYGEYHYIGQVEANRED
jgi:transglutaminase-like putative cysteine protease